MRMLKVKINCIIFLQVIEKQLDAKSEMLKDSSRYEMSFNSRRMLDHEMKSINRYFDMNRNE